MRQEPGQPKATPLRAALGGLSLLLLVAVVVQASPGERSDVVRHGQGPMVRMIAEAMTWRTERQARREDTRPQVAPAYPSVALHRRGLERDRAPRRFVAARRLGAWLTDMPPPASC